MRDTFLRQGTICMDTPEGLPAKDCHGVDFGQKKKKTADIDIDHGNDGDWYIFPRLIPLQDSKTSTAPKPIIRSSTACELPGTLGALRRVGRWELTRRNIAPPYY